MLYKNRTRLETIFRLIDADHSGRAGSITNAARIDLTSLGRISYDEFEVACDLINEFLGQTFTKAMIRSICEIIDIDKDGSIDFNEFLECFRLVESDIERNWC